LVKRAIRQAIAQGSGDVKAERKVDELVDLLLLTYQSASRKIGDK
jgi:predicted HAD superfamily Cof-like phosphohydrolase